jgi:uncharacterized protein
MRAKILSLIEVLIVFILMVLLFWYIQSIPIAKKWSNSLNGLSFPAYAVLLVVSVSIFFLRCPNKAQQLFSPNFKYQLTIIGQSFFPFFVLSVVLSWINWGQWGGAILVSIIEIGLLIWLAWMLKDKQPPVQTISAIGGFLVFPVLHQISSKLDGVVLSIVYFYFFVAMSEEILFRGYIQTRLNTAFGRPKRFFGVQWGWGLLISAMLFGVWHLGWGMETTRWPHVLWTIFAGLIFGYVREKSESIIAPTILHGIMNYGPQAILFYLFWSQ